MKIIIAGAGEVGFHLAKLLSFESQDITLIDTDKERLNYAEKNLDIKTIKGDACSLSLIREANVGSSDLFISVTSQETTNITISVIGKSLGVKKTIARIDNPEFLKNDHIDFKKFGLDYMISPEELAADEIKMLLLDQSALVTVMNLKMVR